MNISNQTNFQERIFAHICNKSIANFQIFPSYHHVTRFLQAIDYYKLPQSNICLSNILRHPKFVSLNPLDERGDQIQIYAYCIMPDHYHILLSAPSREHVSKYISDCENSYTRYFNLKHSRKGPLWQSRFRMKRISDNNIFLHVSRYIHLNPATSHLVSLPQEWPHSSYPLIINAPQYLKRFHIYSIRTPKTYRAFVESNIERQRTLRKLKKYLLD